MGYTREAIKGVSWLTAFRIVTRALSFLKIIVLARVLNPFQFGIFGIASLVLTLLEILTETGINIVLIQSKKNINEFVNSAWVVSILRGILIAFVLFISSPFIASFFNSKESQQIIMFLSLVPFIRGFINPAEVRFRKELKFNYEFWFRSFLFFSDAVISIIFALITHSVYSLAIGLLSGALLEVILSFVFIKPVPKFSIDKNYFNEILHKGKWITANGIFNYFAENSDNIGVGKILGSSSLGIYQVAYKIAILPISEVSDVVSQVVFPVYTKFGDDTQRIRKAFLKTLILTFFASALIGVIIFLFPEFIVRVALGDKWVSAIPVLKVLAIFGILRTIAGPSSAVFLARGKQNYVTLMTFVRFVGLILSIFPFVMIFGLIGAGYSALFSVLIEIPVILFFIIKVFK